jgi:RNA polymerase sigma-70 factor (ECF subfamily)
MTYDMTYETKAAAARLQHFQDAALPHIDDAYTLAHFLMRNQADAEAAVQECYLRARRCFDSFRGPAIKPWLLAILRNVCSTKLVPRSRHETPGELAANIVPATDEPLWLQPQATPEDGAVIRRLIAALPAPYREVIVLREFNDMSYREIADVVSMPVATVMSHLARARAMLLATWKTTDVHEQRVREARSVQGA